ncbi:MAG: phosphoenolpyruvate--protein phosphotransferase [Candidatus Schekmanbacteria bacterium]|nr:phosphoenolpyruvate--protein phosphotransferase [Candidatus Schekmanbacteria bacterium]
MDDFIKGIAVTSGIVIGEAFILDQTINHVPKHNISGNDIEKEIARLDTAVEVSVHQLEEIKSRVEEKLGYQHALIFEAKILMLKDETVRDKTIKRIKGQKINCEWALDEAISELIEIFSGFDDEYLKERKTDIGNIRSRILSNLAGVSHIGISDIKKPVIVIAHDLAPADTALMHKETILGFATDVGGKTSHTAIMARSLEIPAVVGLKNATTKIQSGDRLIIDANSGDVIINPDELTLQKYEEKKRKFDELQKTFLSLHDLPAETADGFKLKIFANIELPEEAIAVDSYGADGIGLYRTEFLYLNRLTTPDEEEQFNNYRKLAETMYPKPVTIRTFDLGGDKYLSQMQMAEELNPAMGLRAIRFCLEQPELFKTQLRAILRASHFGNLRILFPMISGIGELRSAKSILNECRKELQSEGKQFNDNIEVGIMIEVPTAAIIADILAREVNFFSIGTNDLIQYCLAIDRVNEKVAYLYEPLHPAILRLISNIVSSAHRMNIPVCLCGEMAAEPIYAFLLLGLEIDELSTNPISIPNIKRILRNSKLEDAKNVVSRILTMSNAEEIRSHINTFLCEKFPEDFFLID